MDKKTYEPIEFGKIENTELKDFLKTDLEKYNITDVAIEMVACYGMAVGKSVFETCVSIGEFKEILSKYNIKYIYRIREKITICKSVKANDSTIRKALIDRFAKFDFKNGKGTKDNKDFFYGFKADIWASFAVGVTYLEDREVNENNKD